MILRFPGFLVLWPILVNDQNAILTFCTSLVLAMPEVNPEILRWARETAGLTPDEAVRKINLSDAYGVQATHRLAALESGEETPSRPLLVRMAKQYRRPLLTFYLSEPPPESDRGRDFRTLPHTEVNGQEALLDALIREVQARQSLIRAALEEDEDAIALNFVDSMTTDNGVPALRESIARTIQFDRNDFRRERNASAAFEALRMHTESAGVFVLLIGDLGSYHTALDVERFRGFVIADQIAPFVIINDRDSRAAWSFTLLHELTHLWLGQTGISGGPPELEIEQFCNDVASQFLLADQELEELADSELSLTTIVRFAQDRNISGSLVAYRLYRADLISHGRWMEFGAQLREHWNRERSRRRARERSQQGGPSYYVVRRHRLGDRLLGTASGILKSGSLPTSKVARVLGIRSKHLDALLSGTGPSRSTRV